MDSKNLIALCHQQAHYAAHDFEDTVFVSLTRRDIWFLLLATLVLGNSAECFDDQCAEFCERLAELIEVQKDNWRAPPAT